MRLDPTNHARWRRLLLRDVPGLDPARLSLSLDPADAMFAHSLAEHRDAGAAVSQYFAVAVQQYRVFAQVLDHAFGVGRRDLDVLDFACGHGRLLRFAHARVEPDRLIGSDVKADAVEFVRANFRVQTVPSDYDPARFDPGRRFDLIWVASLFSHLPEALFHAWLARLHALLTPRGLLCFSVHDEALRPIADPAGIDHAPVSEDATLDLSCYGTSYVTADFVRAALARGAPGKPWIRAPRALANEQDLYVLASDPDAATQLEPLRTLRRGPWGWVDIRRLQGDALELVGWAASLDDGAVARVEVTVGAGTPVCIVPGEPRPDVAEVLGDARTAHAGWSLRAPIDANRSSVEVEIAAIDRAGARVVLYAGAIERNA